MNCMLVHPGCYNKIPFIGQLINNKHLYLMVLETGKSKIIAPWDSVSGKAHFLVHRWCLLAATLHDVWGKGAFPDLFYKGTNRICEGSSLIT